MSSEVVTLVLEAPVAQPARVWRRLWDLAWNAVAVRRHPACEAFAGEYFEDLLPDQQSVLMHCDDGALRWQFSDFGGAFSAQIGVLAHWFEIGLAREFAAVHRAVEAAGGRVAAREIPRIEAVLRSGVALERRTRGRPMLLARERLWPLFLEGDAVSIEGLDDPTDDERARASQLYAQDATEDPIHANALRSSSSTIREREDFDRNLLLRHADRLETAAREHASTDGALVDAVVCAAANDRDREAAQVWLEKHLALARATDGREALSARMEDEREPVRQLASGTLARAAKSAKGSEKDGVAQWIMRALESSDAVVVEHALSVELEAKRVSDAMLAAALGHEALLRSSKSAGEGLWRWIAARDPRTAGAESLALVERATRVLLASPARAAVDAWLVIDRRSGMTSVERCALHAALREPFASGQGSWRLLWLVLSWNDASSLGLREDDALSWIAATQHEAQAREGAAARTALWAAWMRASSDAATPAIRRALREACVRGWSDADEAFAALVRGEFVVECQQFALRAKTPKLRDQGSRAIVELCVCAVEQRRSQQPDVARLEALHRTVIAVLQTTADRWTREPTRLPGCDPCAEAFAELARAWEAGAPDAAAVARALGASIDVRG